MPLQAVLFQAQGGSWLFLAHTAIAVAMHSPNQSHCLVKAMNQKVQLKDLTICLPSLRTDTPDPVKQNAPKYTHIHTQSLQFYLGHVVTLFTATALPAFQPLESLLNRADL